MRECYGVKKTTKTSWPTSEAPHDEQLDTETVTSVVALIGSYLVGQGIADHGKGKAEIQIGIGRVPT